MDVLSALNVYGSIVLTVMMIFYLIEDRSPNYTLLFGVMCIGTSAYGFLAGTWPFGVIEVAWAGIAVRKYLKIRSRWAPISNAP